MFHYCLGARNRCWTATGHATQSHHSYMIRNVYMNMFFHLYHNISQYILPVSILTYSRHPVTHTHTLHPLVIFYPGIWADIPVEHTCISMSSIHKRRFPSRSSPCEEKVPWDAVLFTQTLVHDVYWQRGRCTI